MPVRECRLTELSMKKILICALMAALGDLVDHPDAAEIVSQLHAAALADEEGIALGAALRGVGRRTGLPVAA